MFIQVDSMIRHCGVIHWHDPCDAKLSRCRRGEFWIASHATSRMNCGCGEDGKIVGSWSVEAERKFGMGAPDEDTTGKNAASG